MSEKPSYLGLLNAISLAETRACEYLSEWIDVTPSPEVRRVLVTVAAREGEHGLAFKKRIVELGYELLKEHAARTSNGSAKTNGRAKATGRAKTRTKASSSR